MLEIGSKLLSFVHEIRHNCEACEALSTLLIFHLQVPSWTAYDGKGGAAGDYGRGTWAHYMSMFWRDLGPLTSRKLVQRQFMWSTLNYVFVLWVSYKKKDYFGGATATVLFSNMMAVYLSFCYIHE